MSQRLPSLINTSIKSGIRTGAQQQQKRATTVRSYATHQEQAEKPSSSSTPLIVAGLLAVGGYVYYSKNKKDKSGNKAPDPSDVSGQKFQKKADQEITKRTDALDSVDVRGQSASTIQNENKELAGHPVATKKDAYVDPSTVNKQTSGSSAAMVSDLKEGVQEQWDKAKQGADRTIRSVEDSAAEAKNKADSELDDAKRTAGSVVDSVEQIAAEAKKKAQATWNQVSTDTSNKVENAKDQANAAASDASKKVDEAKDQAKVTYNEAQSGLDNAEQKAREKASDIKDSLKK